MGTRVICSETNVPGYLSLFHGSYIASTLIALDSRRTDISEAAEGRKRDLHHELRVVRAIQSKSDLKHLHHIARRHEMELRDHLAGNRQHPPTPHSDLEEHFERARKVQKAVEQARRIRKKKAERQSKEREVSAAAGSVPEFTTDHENAAYDLLDHTESYYRSHRLAAVDKAHIDAMEQVNPDHPDLPGRHQSYKNHSANLMAARSALHSGMQKAGIHPAHIGRVLSPEANNIDPHGREHMDAVAHFHGGSHNGNEYQFPGNQTGHHHFYSWAALNHGERLPRRKSGRVRFTSDKNPIPEKTHAPDAQHLIHQYKPPRDPKKSIEDVAVDHAHELRDALVDDHDGSHFAHRIKTKDVKPTKGIGTTGLFHIRRTGGPSHGVLRIYVDRKGRYVDHSGKDDQDRVIQDRAAQRFKSGSYLKRYGVRECVGVSGVTRLQELVTFFI